MRCTKISGVGTPIAVGLSTTPHRLFNLLKPPTTGTAVAAVPCPLCQLCQLCQVAQRVPVPCCRYAHMPMPTPCSQCHPLGQRAADQQRAATCADGNSTKRAPATGMDGRRFPTTGCPLLRIPTVAPGRIAAGQRGDHGRLGYTPCRPAAGTHRAYHLLPPRLKSGRTYANAIQLQAARPGSGRR